ncbi:MAG: hypothetical protein U1F34_05245 [Gammaproteobacteria bacterium]
MRHSSCSVDISGFPSGSTPSSIGNIPSDAGVAYTIKDADPVSGAAAFHVNLRSLETRGRLIYLGWPEDK